MKPRVFVSRPAVLSQEQDLRCQRWLRHLGLLGFEPFALDRGCYDAVPWDQLRAAVREADGVLVLGFRQLHVNQGVWRPETSECRAAARWWGTPWNQIEAGLALTAPLPVLVAPEDGVAEGVFCPAAWGGNLFGVNLDINLEVVRVPAAEIGDESLAVVAAWAQAVKDGASAASMSST